MKKIFALLMTTLMLVGVLAGCVQEDIGVSLNKDGTGSVALTLGLEQEFYEQLKATGADPFEGKTTTTYKDGDDTYVAYIEKTEYSSYVDIEKALLDMEYQYDKLNGAGDNSEPAETDPSEYTLYQPEKTEPDQHIFKSVDIESKSGIFYSTYTFKAVMNPQPKESGGYESNDMFKVTVTVEMPSEITQSKGGKVEGNKIVFDIEDITEETELAATSEANNVGVVIAIVAVLVLIAAVVVFLVKRQK